MHAVWATVVLCGFVDLILYFKCVRCTLLWFNRSYAHELCDLYLLRHMLPDGHPLEFLFYGLPRNREHPRLLWPCITVLVDLVVFVCATICAMVFTFNGMIEDGKLATILGLSNVGTMALTTFTLMLIPTIQNNLCFREMTKTGFIGSFKIKNDIEKNWPGFYSAD